VRGARQRRPQASIPGEIVPGEAFYSYEDKYAADSLAQTRIPAALDDATRERVRETAVRAYRTLECTGMARVDFFIEHGTGTLFINELNTIPGFTSISMYPKMWEASGRERSGARHTPAAARGRAPCGAAAPARRVSVRRAGVESAGAVRSTGG
jgi:D-alanine--D-alanine ligase